MLKDDAERSFTDEGQFLSFLNERTEASTWLSGVDVSAIRFDSLLPSALPADADETLRDTAENGTKLFMSLSDRPFPLTGIRACALSSIAERIGISGRALTQMPKDRLSSVLTWAAEAFPNATCALNLADGKISAVLSDNGNGNSYTHMSADEVFTETERCIWEMAQGDADHFEGWWSYGSIRCTWILPCMQQFAGEMHPVAITMSTSDIGRGSVTYGASLIDTGLYIPLMDSLRIPHRDNASRNDVSEALNMIRSSLDKSIRKLNALSKIQIDHPVTAMKRIMKKFKLPKKQGHDALQDYIFHRGYDPASALDLYIAICGIIPYYRTVQSNEEWRQKLQGNILRIAGCDWKSYDLPGDFNW